MPIENLSNISAIDGRYQPITHKLSSLLSEYALIKYRVHIEIEWFIHLCSQDEVSDLQQLSAKNKRFLRDIAKNFSPEDAHQVKAIECRTNHDVKAVEYYLRQQCSPHNELSTVLEFWHFACTSEDINNLSYALMLKDSVQLLMSEYEQLIAKFAMMAKEFAHSPMLSRTHGQSASGTTMGKEMANIGYRLYRQLEQLEKQQFLGKINGAVGNYNAHLVAYPHIDWPRLANDFITHLGCQPNPYTTQIEPHDYCAEIAHNMMRINTILLDACRDIWGYISLNYFEQKIKKGEVGSSTMPHKVNPIDFENAEGNLGAANALFGHMAEKLPISRWQRDLSDSTLQRNWGSAFGHILIALHSLKKGLDKLELSPVALSQDLQNHPEILTEAIQTVMRSQHIANSYDIIKEHSRGKGLNRQKLHHMIADLPLCEEAKAKIKRLTVEAYVGNAKEQAESFYRLWCKRCKRDEQIEKKPPLK